MTQDPLQQLQKIIQTKAANGDTIAGGTIPITVPQSIDAVDAENLPPQTPWKWEEVCKLVGSLYLESHHRHSTLETHAKSITRQLDEQRRVLVRENEAMQKAMSELESELNHRDKTISELRDELNTRD